MVIAQQHAEQLADVESITLGSTLAAADFNSGGIHHVVGDAVGQQKPMEPKPFSTCFVTTDYRSRFRETEAALGLGNFLEYAFLIPCRYGALARLVAMAGGEAKLPGFLTQFKGYKQGHISYVTIRIVGYCGGHKLCPYVVIDFG
jgi:hypothetical protein